MLTAYMYLSWSKGNGNRLIFSGLLRKVKSSRNVSCLNLMVISSVLANISSASAFGRKPSTSKLKYELLSLEARNADHDLAASGFFLVGKINIIVLDIAVDR